MTIAADHMSRQTGKRVTIKRYLLAWYLDFIIFSVVVLLGAYFAEWTLGRTLLAQFVGFFVLRFLYGYFLQTPGMTLLGIQKDGTRDLSQNINENWATLLVGTLFLLDGSKRAVRWTEYPRAIPEFGILPDETDQMILSLGWGLTLMVAGALLLQMKRSGLFLALFLTLLGLFSVILSWPILDQAIAQEVVARRTAQGVGYDPGEIEFMQDLIPKMMIGGNVLLLAALLAIQNRFFRH
jgi:hypothetical protein